MPAPLQLRRRGILLGSLVVAVSAAALSGCDADDLKPHDATPTASTPVASPGQPTPDEQLVDTVATAVLTTMGTVIAARRVKELKAPLALVLHTHRAHLKALKKQDAPPHVVGPAVASEALRSVHAAEGQLQGSLVDAAEHAESGTLATMFASMSAAIAQLLASGVLTTPVVP